MLLQTFRKIWWAHIAFGSGRNFGCICPDFTLYYLREDFGDDLECDGIDKMIGYGDRRAATADILNIPRDSPVVLSAYRAEREKRPQYEFQINFEQSSIIIGHVNRGEIRFEWNAEYEPSVQVNARIEAFLSSLQIGQLDIYRL